MNEFCFEEIPETFYLYHFLEQELVHKTGVKVETQDK